MKTLTSLTVLLSLLLLHAFGTSTHSRAAQQQGVGPQPGGAVVIHHNPALANYGPTFAIGYNHGGDETTQGGVTYHELEIGSDEHDIQVGLYTGTRATLTEDETYVVVIADMEGPTVEITNKNDPNETYTVSIGDGTNGDFKSPVFAAISRKQTVGGVDYIRVCVVKGNDFVFFDVNEVTP